jgi:hypothetical protein
MRFIITRETATMGYAVLVGDTYFFVDGVRNLLCPIRPQIVGTPAVILAAREESLKRCPHPSVCKFFIGDQAIDDSRTDPTTCLRFLVQGEIDEMVVTLLPIRHEAQS